jgi:hypothetical protein
MGKVACPLFLPLDFLAELTQHIPNKGEHLIRYYGHYSNKARGMRARRPAANRSTGVPVRQENVPNGCRRSSGGVLWYNTGGQARQRSPAGQLKNMYRKGPIRCLETRSVCSC